MVVETKTKFWTVGSDKFATYPEWCPKQAMNCTQCYLSGKISCAPRFRQGMKSPKEVSIEVLLRRGLRPIEVQKQLGIPIKDVYVVGKRLRRMGVIKGVFKFFTTEQKEIIGKYIKEHPDEKYKDISKKFNVESSFVSKIAHSVGVFRKEELCRRLDTATAKALSLIKDNPEKSIAAIAQEVGVKESTLADRVRAKGVLPINHTSRLVLDMIRREVKLAVREALAENGFVK